MRKIVIVGGGQAGLQLGFGLVQGGYDVTVVSNRAPDEIREGRVMSSQCMFDAALQHERTSASTTGKASARRSRGSHSRFPLRRGREGDRLGVTPRLSRTGFDGDRVSG